MYFNPLPLLWFWCSDCLTFSQRELLQTGFWVILMYFSHLLNTYLLSDPTTYDSLSFYFPFSKPVNSLYSKEPAAFYWGWYLDPMAHWVTATEYGLNTSLTHVYYLHPTPWQQSSVGLMTRNLASFQPLSHTTVSVILPNVNLSLPYHVHVHVHAYIHAVRNTLETIQWLPFGL